MENKDIPMPPLPPEQQVAEQPVAAQQVAEQPVVEQEVLEEPKQGPQEVPVAAPKEETVQQQNFASLRKEKERLQQENQEAMNRLREYENKKTEAPEEDLEINLNDDDLFEGKHYKKLQKQLKKQHEELRKYQEQISAAATETKLRAKFNDFDSVLTPDNIQKLRESEPEIAETISSAKDVYTKAVSAYKMIKKLGIYKPDLYSQDRETAQKNSLKPRPSASVSPQQGSSPLARANAFADGLTPELQKQLLSEMNESAKNY